MHALISRVVGAAAHQDADLPAVGRHARRRRCDALPDATPVRLDDPHRGAALARYTVPREVDILDVLPRNAPGRSSEGPAERHPE